MGLFKDINLNSRLLGYLQPLIILSLWKFLDQDLLYKSVRRKKRNTQSEYLMRSHSNLF